MKFSNVYGIKSKSIIDALMGDDYDLSDRPSNVFSATEVIDAPKIRVLQRRHQDDVATDVSDNFHMLDGSAVHYAVERSNKNKDRERLSEERIFIQIGGDHYDTWKAFTLKAGEKVKDAEWYSPDKFYVSCKFDNYEHEDGVLEDYKRTSAWEAVFGIKESREQQLNVGALGMRLLGFPVNTLRACLLLKDWNQRALKDSEQRGSGNYPKIPYAEREFTPWDNEMSVKYVIRCVSAHVRAASLEDNKISPCTPEERWYAGEQIAVLKEGVKTAKRVFKVDDCDSREQAVSLANICMDTLREEGKGKYLIEVRPGSDKRCVGYCKVCTFCHYWKEKYQSTVVSEDQADGY